MINSKTKCAAYFYVKLAQARIILDEENSIETAPNV